MTAYLPFLCATPRKTTLKLPDPFTYASCASNPPKKAIWNDSVCEPVSTPKSRVVVMDSVLGDDSSGMGVSKWNALHLDIHRCDTEAV